MSSAVGEGSAMQAEARANEMGRQTLALTRELITRKSVTPDDAGCQDLLAQRLAQQLAAGHRARDHQLHQATGEIQYLQRTGRGDQALHMPADQLLGADGRGDRGLQLLALRLCKWGRG